MNERPPTALVAFGTTLATLALAVALWPSPALAQSPGSPFEPASPQARAISDLFILTLALAAVVFLIVQGILVYVVLRFRARPGHEEPQPVFENRRLEITWTAIPVVILAILFVVMIPAMGAAESVPSDAYTVDVTGHQFWWEFRYPQTANAIAANEMHIPVGEKVRVTLQSADVIHSFWIPRLNGKMDLIPGQTNVWVIQADTAGEYVGQCAELCGYQHAWMLLRAFAEPRPQFDAWVSQQAANAVAPTGTLAQQGQQLFATYACGNCHAIRGTDAAGNVGPDLTHVASRTTLGAGVLTNTPDNLRRWLDNPQAVKPSSNMPSFRFSKDQVNALATYLEGLK
jgi:cytochrome c oxidase subunit 2